MFRFDAGGVEFFRFFLGAGGDLFEVNVVFELGGWRLSWLVGGGLRGVLRRAQHDIGFFKEKFTEIFKRDLEFKKNIIDWFVVGVD